jgi:hypothetical protein
MADAPVPAVGPAANDDLASLIATADRATQWSVTADHLKAGVSRARLAAFALTLIGACAATIASQIPAEQPTVRNAFAVIGAVALAIVAFLTGRLLTSERIGAWVKVRAAAEALKREAFRYAAGAKPYDDATTAAGLLDQERQKIDAGVAGIVPISPDRPGSSPRKRLSPDEYRSTRVQGQVNFYETKSDGAARSAKRLRLAEFVLAAAATVVTAASTITGKQIPLMGLSFDIAALTALLTTLSGAVLSHIEASRLDQIATSYAATASRLKDLDVGFAKAKGQLQAWSDFVNRGEEIIATENQSWIARWSSSSSSVATLPS